MNQLSHLVLGQLGLDPVWVVGDLHLRVQGLLRLLEPLHQFVPRLVELRKERVAGPSHMFSENSYAYIAKYFPWVKRKQYWTSIGPDLITKENIRFTFCTLRKTV